MITIKVVLMFAILVAGAAGGAFPLYRHRVLDSDRLLGWGNAFAAGVFLGAGLIHMLPDADAAWVALGWSYPMAFLMAAVAFVLMLLIEHVLLPDDAHQMVHAPSGERFAHVTEHSHGGLAAYAVVTTLAVHSFLAGLALGAEPELSGALVIFLAILAHKSTAGFALGVSLVRNQIPSRLAWGLLGLFVAATPVGILVGTLLGEVLEGTDQLTFEATFLSLAAGTFAYVATLDILRDEFSEPGRRWSKWSLVVAGTALMGVLALWA